tara:strand:+ start:10876 stop:12576 length:1701 start_codon:yes stop_codon:yes gene_type:complete
MDNLFKNWRVPIDNPKEFYGRKEQFEVVYRELLKLSGASSIEIIGERRIGKTSLLKMISKPKFLKLNGLYYSNFIFILFDMQGSEMLTPKEFRCQMISLIKDDLESRNQEKYDKTIKFIDKIEKSTEIRQFDFERICKELKKLNIKLVILFDEFDSLEKHSELNVDFFDALRRIQTANYVLYITASTKRINQFVPTQIATSSFFSYFDRVYIGLLEKDEAKDLVISESKKIKVELENEELEFILNYAGTHPVLLKIVTYYFIKNRKDFNNKINIIKKEIIKEAKEIIDPQWDRLDTKKQLIILSVLKEERINENLIEEIQDLKERGFLIEKDKLRLFSKLFEEIISSKDDKATSNLKNIFGNSWVKLSKDNQISLRTAEITLENFKQYPEEELDWDGIINSYRKVFESEIREKIFDKIKEEPNYAIEVIKSEEEYSKQHTRYTMNRPLLSFMKKDSNHLLLGEMGKALRDNDAIKSFLKKFSNKDSFYEYEYPKDSLPKEVIYNDDFSKLTNDSWNILGNVVTIVAKKYRNPKVHGSISPKNLCFECRENLLSERKIIKRLLDSLD